MLHVSVVTRAADEKGAILGTVSVAVFFMHDAGDRNRVAKR